MAFFDNIKKNINSVAAEVTGNTGTPATPTAPATPATAPTAPAAPVAPAPQKLEDILLARSAADPIFVHWFYPDEGKYLLILKKESKVLEINDVKSLSHWTSVDGVLYAKVRRKATGLVGLLVYKDEELKEALPSMYKEINIDAAAVLTATATDGTQFTMPLKKEVRSGPIEVKSLAELIAQTQTP